MQEAKLSLLPMKHCKQLTTAGNYQFWGKFDLCAGLKKKFKTIQKFKKTPGGSYVNFENETNYFGLNKDGKYKLDYYVAGSDSCSGDSGGGLYHWKNGKPRLIGVISRGWGAGEKGSGGKNGCAEMNFPGVYSRVTYHLKWIHENSKDGNCKG